MKAKKFLSTIVFAVMLVVSMGITAMADTDADVAKIGDETYSSLAEAFKNAKRGDTIELLSDITVTETIHVTNQEVLNDITLDGNNNTITDGTSSILLLFGDNANSKWCTGVKIKDLTITGTAKYAIYLTGGTSSELTNVKVEGTYSYGIVFYGTHGGTVTDCNIVSAFTNGQDDNPLKLVNSTFGSLVANNSVAGEGAKVFLDENSKINELTVGGNSTIMIDPASLARVGSVTSEEGALVAEVNGVRYATLQAAVDAADDGEKVEIIADVADEAVTTSKSITITSSDKKTLNNVSITAGGTALTVSNLKFTGNSWIDSSSASELTVSNVEANVEPSNGTATNSRSAFISLGANEGQKLKLTVTGCNIVVPKGTDAVLGWAQITEALISRNTFGSDDAYIGRSDSGIADAVKIMSIADGAIIKVTNNTVYSNSNGFAFYQNTTRDNAYTVIVDGNAFYGEADHIWVEIGGTATTKATIKATSNNTVNGEQFTVDDIKKSRKITTWTSYAGVDVETNEEGKVISGTLASFSNMDTIAGGYEAVANADGSYSVQEEVSIFGKSFYIPDMTQTDKKYYKVGLFAGIDSLKYKKVGFKIFDGTGISAESETRNVYKSITVGNETVTAERIGSYRIFGLPVDFPVAWDNIPLYYQPFAVDMNDNEILGDTYTIEDIYTKTSNTVEEGAE